MKQIVMYWSNICVLSRYEQQHIERVRKELQKDGIDLQTEFFGLGYPSRMSEAMLDDTKPLPDIIISTDLEVFENRDLYRTFAGDLYPVSTWFPLKTAEQYRDLCGDPKLLPFIAIPMMLYTRDASYPYRSLAELSDANIALGGINNSAVKCIFKYLWYRFGKERASAFLSRSKIYDMPIQGMHAVRTGAADAALIPSIYALRADMEHEFAYPLSDGCICLPAFAAVRNRIDEDLARTVLAKLLTMDFCNYYVSNGDLLSCIRGTDEGRFESLADARYLYPKNGWFDRIRPAEFYEAYCRILPTAKDYSRPLIVR